MCGLVGAAGKLTSLSGTIFKQMLYLDQLRGMDATGIAAYSTDPKVLDLYKKAYPAQDFLQLLGADRIIYDSKSYSVLMGHNRAASRGLVTHANAHPFQSEHIVLAHNGTLTGKGGLEEYQHSVDSGNIAPNMVKMGEIETLEGLSGSYALTWINTKNDTLNFARNSDRPLHYAVVDEVMYWSSEKGLLRWVLERNNISLKVIYIPKPLRMFTVDLKTLSTKYQDYKAYSYSYKYAEDCGYSWEAKYESGADTLAGKRSFMLLKSYEALPQLRSRGTCRGEVLNNGERYAAITFALEEDTYKKYDGKWMPVKILSVRYEGVKSLLVCTPLPESTVGPVGYNGRELTTTEFFKKTDGGCVKCHKRVTLKDAPRLLWSSEDEFNCPTCTEEIFKPGKKAALIEKGKEMVKRILSE